MTTRGARVGKYAGWRFVNLWLVAVWQCTLLLLLLWLLSPAFAKTLLTTNLRVFPDEQVALAPLRVTPRFLGALRVEATANLPNSRWVTYEIQVLDAQQQPILAGIKQAWRESGTWSEDGESGTWSEEDLRGGFDFRSKQSETITIAVQVLEYGNTAGAELNEPVDFFVRVQSGAIDGRYLGLGAVGVGAIALMSAISTSLNGKWVLVRATEDSDVSGRAVLGGKQLLVKVAVNVRADETTPKSLRVQLIVRDRVGDDIYTNAYPMAMQYQRDDEGEILGATGSIVAYFTLVPRADYGFAVEVTPDEPVERAELIVSEGIRTFAPVTVTCIEAREG